MVGLLSQSFFGLVSKLYHNLTQPAGLVAVGINFALALLDVLTGFLLSFRALDKLEMAASATKFAFVLEFSLA